MPQFIIKSYGFSSSYSSSMVLVVPEASLSPTFFQEAVPLMNHHAVFLIFISLTDWFVIFLHFLHIIHAVYLLFIL